MPNPYPTRVAPHSSEEGFALIGLVVAIFLILLALSVAAPTVAKALRREREVEAVHRANQYVNAIRRYHLKTNTYPASLEQLDKTNNVRYLREKYIDPMTGKPDWRLIKVGENKTSVKGFFGQPLAGLASTGLGAGSTSASSSNSGIGGASSALGASSGSASASAFGASGLSSASSAASTTAPSTTGTSDTDTSSFGGSTSPNAGTGPGGSTPTGSSGIRNQSANASSGLGAPFLGVGLPIPGSAIIVVNEQTTYPEWEFLYDPRIEQLKAKVNLFGGGMSSTSSSSLGSLSGSQSNQSTSPTPGIPPTPVAVPQ